MLFLFTQYQRITRENTGQNLWVVMLLSKLNIMSLFYYRPRVLKNSLVFMFLKKIMQTKYILQITQMMVLYTYYTRNNHGNKGDRKNITYFDLDKCLWINYTCNCTNMSIWTAFENILRNVMNFEFVNFYQF